MMLQLYDCHLAAELPLKQGLLAFPSGNNPEQFSKEDSGSKEGGLFLVSVRRHFPLL